MSGPSSAHLTWLVLPVLDISSHAADCGRAVEYQGVAPIQESARCVLTIALVAHCVEPRAMSCAADLPAPARASGHAVRTRLRVGSKAPENPLAEVPRAEKPARCRGPRSLRSGSKAPRDRKRSGGSSSRMPIKRRELAVDLPPEQLPEEDLDEQDAMQAILSASVPPVKGPWSTHEDEQLSALVRQYGAKRWSLIASKLPGASASRRAPARPAPASRR